MGELECSVGWGSGHWAIRGRSRLGVPPYASSLMASRSPRPRSLETPFDKARYAIRLRCVTGTKLAKPFGPQEKHFGVAMSLQVTPQNRLVTRGELTKPLDGD